MQMTSRGRALGTHTVRGAAAWVAPKILAAALAAFWAVAFPASGADAELNRPSRTLIEITGGSGKAAWRLRYGISPHEELKTLLSMAGAERAYFSNANWLRLIDTKKGSVIGRWHFPGDEIVRLVPRGDVLDVGIEEKGYAEEVFRRTLELDPPSPVIPFWPSGWLLLYRFSLSEAQLVWPSINLSGTPTSTKVSAEEAKRLLPELEEVVRRDPLTPWFRIALGKVLWDLGDPRSAEVFGEAVRLPSNDFTELFPISSYLETLGEKGAARDAFELAYRDFWARGNDPRLFLTLIGKFALYHSGGNDWGNPATEEGRELIERSYKLIPYGEAAEFAWLYYAAYLQENGRTAEAKVWQARADEAKKNSPSLWGGPAVPPGSLDRLLLVIAAAFLGTILYWLALYARYRPQRRLNLAAAQKSTRFPRRFGFFSTEYWSRRERFAFFTIVFGAWFAMGVVGQYVQFILRVAAIPVSMGMGTFAGPQTVSYLDRWFPPTPERDLLLAFAYQQSGEMEKAERLYRALPQFAEGWNNLGVILKTSGKEQEARQAFERALKLDPGLPEAALNLGRGPQSFWTQQHEKYLPGRPMLAPPSQARWARASMGYSFTMVLLQAFAGPFSGERLGVPMFVNLFG